MPYMEKNRTRIYFETQGQGPPLFLISGLGGGCWSWYGQVPFFYHHHRVITMDNRGAGRSTIPPAPYDMSDFAADALDLLDHLHIQRTLVVGISMGGMIAQELALMAPDRLESMVLACTHCGGRAKISPEADIVARLIQNDGLSREQVVRKNLPLFFSESFLENHPQEVEAYCRVQCSAPVQPEFAFQAQLEAISRFDTQDRLGQIRIPTLIVTGTLDVLVPPGNAHTLHRGIPGSELVEVPGAGHALHVECRELLNALSARFFRRHALEDRSRPTN